MAASSSARNTAWLTHDLYRDEQISQIHKYHSVLYQVKANTGDRIYAVKQFVWPTGPGAAAKRREIDLEGEMHAALRNGPHIIFGGKTFINRKKQTLEIHMDFHQHRFSRLLENTKDDRGIRSGLVNIPPFYYTVLTQMLEALKYIHGKGIMHRNLRAENIVYDTEDHFVLTDLSLARYTHHPPSDGIGPLEYSAPEKFELQKETTAVDLWSLGVLCLDMLFVVPRPHPGYYNFGFMKRLSWCQTINKLGQSCTMTEIEKMVRMDPAERVTASDLLESSELKGTPRKRPLKANTEMVQLSIELGQREMDPVALIALKVAQEREFAARSAQPSASASEHASGAGQRAASKDPPEPSEAGPLAAAKDPDPGPASNRETTPLVVALGSLLASEAALSTSTGTVQRSVAGSSGECISERSPKSERRGSTGNIEPIDALDQGQSELDQDMAQFLHHSRVPVLTGPQALSSSSAAAAAQSKASHEMVDSSTLGALTALTATSNPAAGKTASRPSQAEAEAEAESPIAIDILVPPRLQHLIGELNQVYEPVDEAVKAMAGPSSSSSVALATGSGIEAERTKGQPSATTEISKATTKKQRQKQRVPREKSARGSQDTGAAELHPSANLEESGSAAVRLPAEGSRSGSVAPARGPQLKELRKQEEAHIPETVEREKATTTNQVEPGINQAVPSAGDHPSLRESPRDTVSGGPFEERWQTVPMRRRSGQEPTSSRAPRPEKPSVAVPDTGHLQSIASPHWPPLAASKDGLRGSSQRKEDKGHKATKTQNLRPAGQPQQPGRAPNAQGTEDTATPQFSQVSRRTIRKKHSAVAPDLTKAPVDQTSHDSLEVGQTARLAGSRHGPEGQSCQRPTQLAQSTGPTGSQGVVVVRSATSQDTNLGPGNRCVSKMSMSGDVQANARARETVQASGTHGSLPAHQSAQMRTAGRTETVSQTSAPGLTQQAPETQAVADVERNQRHAQLAPAARTAAVSGHSSTLSPSRSTPEISNLPTDQTVYNTLEALQARGITDAVDVVKALELARVLNASVKPRVARDRIVDAAAHIARAVRVVQAYRSPDHLEVRKVVREIARWPVDISRLLSSIKDTRVAISLASLRSLRTLGAEDPNRGLPVLEREASPPTLSVSATPFIPRTTNRAAMEDGHPAHQGSQARQSSLESSSGSDHEVHPSFRPAEPRAARALVTAGRVPAERVRSPWGQIYLAWFRATLPPPPPPKSSDEQTWELWTRGGMPLLPLPPHPELLIYQLWLGTRVHHQAWSFETVLQHEAKLYYEAAGCNMYDASHIMPPQLQPQVTGTGRQRTGHSPQEQSPSRRMPEQRPQQHQAGLRPSGRGGTPASPNVPAGAPVRSFPAGKILPSSSLRSPYQPQARSPSRPSQATHHSPGSSLNMLPASSSGKLPPLAPRQSPSGPMAPSQDAQPLGRQQRSGSPTSPPRVHVTQQGFQVPAGATRLSPRTFEQSTPNLSTLQRQLSSRQPPAPGAPPASLHPPSASDAGRVPSSSGPVAQPERSAEPSLAGGGGIQGSGLKGTAEKSKPPAGSSQP